MTAETTPSTSPTDGAGRHGPTLSGTAALKLLTELGGPLVAGGVIARRRSIMPLLERLQTDADTVATVVKLREQYGPGPLRLTLPGRTVVLPLIADDVERILAESPSPFTPANREKKAALSPFQPHGVLISQGSVRDTRRTFNENVLDMNQPLHHLAGSLAPTIRAEALDLTSRLSGNGGVLDASDFIGGWWRLVRRIVLGDAARDDHDVTDDLWALRSRGNWSYVLPARRRLRERFLDRLYDYVSDAEPLTLAGAVVAERPDASVDPVGQMPHWLFAFDAAGIVALRALALLAAQPDKLARARREIDQVDLTTPQVLPYLQGCIMESVRLWPTTPAILRDSTAPTTWGSGNGKFEIDSGAAFLILASAFHRDPVTVPFANEFTPEAWLDGRAETVPALVPFSAGPARCPGENLVLFTTSMMLANVIDSASELQQISTPSLSAGAPLPATVNHYSIKLRAR